MRCPVYPLKAKLWAKGAQFLGWACYTKTHSDSFVLFVSLFLGVCRYSLPARFLGGACVQWCIVLTWCWLRGWGLCSMADHPHLMPELYNVAESERLFLSLPLSLSLTVVICLLTGFFSHTHTENLLGYSRLEWEVAFVIPPPDRRFSSQSITRQAASSALARSSLRAKAFRFLFFPRSYQESPFSFRWGFLKRMVLPPLAPSAGWQLLQQTDPFVSSNSLKLQLA